MHLRIKRKRYRIIALSKNNSCTTTHKIRKSFGQFLIFALSTVPSQQPPTDETKCSYCANITQTMAEYRPRSQSHIATIKCKLFCCDLNARALCYSGICWKVAAVCICLTYSLRMFVPKEKFKRHGVCVCVRGWQTSFKFVGVSDQTRAFYSLNCIAVLAARHFKMVSHVNHRCSLIVLRPKRGRIDYKKPAGPMTYVPYHTIRTIPTCSL